VRVVGARGATGFVLPVASEAFEESGRTLVRGTLDYLQGLKVGVLVLGCTSFTRCCSPLPLQNIDALECLFCKQT
jgi:hypothetical protein